MPSCFETPRCARLLSMRAEHIPPVTRGMGAALSGGTLFARGSIRFARLNATFREGMDCRCRQ
jgi:hypothetical protein